MNGQLILKKGVKLLIAERGEQAAKLELLAAGLSTSVIDKIIRGRYKFSLHGSVHRKLKPVIKKYTVAP